MLPVWSFLDPAWACPWQGGGRNRVVLDLRFHPGRPVPAAVTISRNTLKSQEYPAGVVTSVAINTGAVQANGLVIEPSHANTLPHSEAFDNAAWLKVGGGSGATPTVTADAGSAPDGTATADRVQFSSIIGGSGNNSLIGQSYPSPGNDVVTFSLWARGTSGSGTTRIFLVSGTEIVGSASVDYTTAWKRFTVTGRNSGGGLSANIGAFGADAPNQAAADVLLWGAQVESGAYARSYVPTTSGTATCDADMASVLAQVLPIASGAVEVNFTPPWTTGAFQLLDSRTSNATSPPNGLYLGVGATTLLFGAGGDISNGASVDLSWVAGRTYLIRGEWGGGTFRLFRDGQLVATATGKTMPGSQGPVRLGRTYVDTGLLDGQLSRVAIFGSAPGTPITGVAIGDSVTLGVGATTPWPTLVSNAVGTVLINAGVGGNTTTQMVTRWGDTYVSLRAPQAVIMGGLNDSSSATAIADLETIAASAAANGSYVLLLAMTPGISGGAVATTVNAALQSYALAHPGSVTFVDTYTPLNDPANPGHLLPAYDSGDGVHPNQAGVNVIAGLVIAAIP